MRDRDAYLASIKIEDCYFSTRVENILRRSGRYKTLADLDQAADPELLRLDNFGRKSLKEIRDMISDPKHYVGNMAEIMTWAANHPDLVRSMINLEAEIYRIIAERLVPSS